MSVNVVVAHQSPTLFNQLAKSTEWNLFMSPMGDHEGLAELELCRVPIWPEDSNQFPDLVLVCSPMQLSVARSRWPIVKRLWVLHNGMNRSLLPAELESNIDGAICFSNRVRWLQDGRSVPLFYVSPAYEPDPIWKWRPGLLWSMISRPLTRDDDRELVIPAVTRRAGGCEIFGQERPSGFIGEARKRELLSSCSAYVSCLTRSAGFGLAEHEAMAAGCPIIGGWWGDMPEELGLRYWGLQDQLSDMANAAYRVTQQDFRAEQLSDLGLKYIAEHRTLWRMDETIRALLGNVL